MKKITLRVYKGIVREWRDDIGRVYYQEIYYREYDENGDLVAVGTEDFTPERYRAQTKLGYVYAWDGEKRNKGGKRWFECLGSLRYRNSKGGAAAAREVFKKWQPQWAEIEIRGC